MGIPASRAARWQKLSMPYASPEITTAFVGRSESTSRIQSSSADADGRRVPTMAMPILSFVGRVPLQKSCFGQYFDACNASGYFSGVSFVSILFRTPDVFGGVVLGENKIKGYKKRYK